jgi:hypothetical protein
MVSREMSLSKNICDNGLQSSQITKYEVIEITNPSAVARIMIITIF